MGNKLQFSAWNAALIYQESDYQINHQFADAIIQELKNQSIQSKLLILHENKKLDLSNYDLIINRTRKADFLTNLKPTCKVFNHPIFTKMANDKFETYKWAKLNRIKTISTKIYQNEDSKSYSYPAVIKSRDGHGGSEVYKVDNLKALEQLNQLHQKDKYIIQDYDAKGNRDIRVYIMFNKIFFCVERIANHNEFRSNFGINQNAKRFYLTLKQRLKIKSIIKKLPLGFYSLDFFIHRKNKLVLNEIEDVVGSRTIYHLKPNINIPKILVSKIVYFLKRPEKLNKFDKPLSIKY